ncbi:SHOCT domain-containing protein [Adhaeribacter rhizoryzae]|uniref:SHOCT domain-containing protein n=1 Tax=Adhaeribacter rhizoryzae TaxID=2607907 RepID=A0A5M6DT04_9BACT|nr:SHOCT domain-containing protein [Adhaeribacter rhizoryzae]KAA5549436.1 SHOCT domain-containing protein [Adhaeribacter rhizoryzae]
MENDFSALKSLQELKNLLDSGAITQQEYEVLKGKIIFGNSSSSSATPPNAVPPVAPASPEVPKTTVPQSVAANPLTPEYQRVTNTAAENKVNAPENVNRNEYLGDNTINQPEELSEVKRKDWLLTILITLAVVLLIGLVAYQFFSDSESERLTSISGPDAEEVTTAAEPATETEENIAATTPAPVVTDTARLNQPKEPIAAVNTTPTELTTPETATQPTTENPATTTVPVTPPPASKITDEEALNKIKDRLQAYYADMKTAPFAAQNHFAPTVERYYTLTGTTPQAINENISSYHFNEFQDSQSSIEDGSLKMTNRGDNNYEVTYIEHGTAFRKSKGQKQETTARVRARFDKDFKLTYFRQEQLLENRFIEE